MRTELKFVPLPQKQSITWQSKYLETLNRPMDGMWFQISQSCQFWKIRLENEDIGYFCVDENNTLLQFFITPKFWTKVDFVIDFLITRYNLRFALVSTGDRVLLTSCLEHSRNIELHTYLFSESNPLEIPLINQDTYKVEKAKKTNFDTAVSFYIENIGTERAWTERYTESIIKKEGLYFFFLDSKLIGIGEYRVSEHQLPYVDLGVIVAQGYRSQNHGSSIIAWLRNWARKNEKIPICSCEHDNKASLNTLTKAGFSPLHKLFKLNF